MREGLIPRRLAGVGTLGLVVGLLFLVSGVVPAGAQGQSGNVECSDFGLLELARFEEAELPDQVGESSQENGVTITAAVVDDGLIEFDWTSATPIDMVIVKAGSESSGGGSIVYSYEEATSDEGLTGPEGKAISHITFCYDVVEETTTTTEAETTTTTEAETTTTTEAETTTTTEAETTTTEATTTTTVQVLPTVLTTTTTVAAVAETLPFTGPEGGSLAGLGAALMTMGGLMLATAWSRKRWAD